jgi:hypothetical protein
MPQLLWEASPWLRNAGFRCAGERKLTHSYTLRHTHIQTHTPTCSLVMLKLMTHMWRSTLDGKRGLERRVVAYIWNLEGVGGAESRLSAMCLCAFWVCGHKGGITTVQPWIQSAPPKKYLIMANPAHNAPPKKKFFSKGAPPCSG